MYSKAKCKISIIRAIMVIVVLIASLPATAQNKDSILSQEKKRDNFFWKTVDWVDRSFIRQDTFYVSPNKYNLFVMPIYTNTKEYYHFAEREKKQSITLESTPTNSIGLKFGWRWIQLGYSIGLDNYKPEINFDLGLYSAGLGLELLLHKRNEGYQISNIKGLNKNQTANYIDKLTNFKIAQGGARLFYVFNYKKFSFPAVYRHSTIQRINAGSFIIGATYHQKIFELDYTNFDYAIQEEMGDGFKFKEARYMNITINTGYSYNWVFAKDFVANFSFMPSVGYKGSEKNSKFIQNINFDAQARMTVVYNNQRYFAGISFLAHAYSYNNNSLRIIQEVNTLKVYIGYNFLRRKH